MASFPLIIWYEYFQLQAIFTNIWFLYAIIIGVSYLMVSNVRFMAMKFRDFTFSNNMLKYILAIISLISIILLKWLSVPLIFLLYLVFSVFSKEPNIDRTRQDETLDVTV